jgi:hypothetical protein
MQTLKPSICKYDGSRSLCDCTDLNIKEEQRKCITYSRGKRVCDIANYGTIFKKNRVTLFLLSGF